MTTAVAVETFTCDTCPATDPDLFVTFAAGETWDERICDECLEQHADARAAAQSAADAYYR